MKSQTSFTTRVLFVPSFYTLPESPTSASTLKSCSTACLFSLTAFEFSCLFTVHAGGHLFLLKGLEKLKDEVGMVSFCPQATVHSFLSMSIPMASIPFISEFKFTSTEAEVYTLFTTMTDYTTVPVIFHGNQIMITDKEVVFGSSETAKITTVNDQVIFQAEGVQLPFEPGKAFSEIAKMISTSWHFDKVDGGCKFPSDILPSPRRIEFVSYCTCHLQTRCYECGVLDCGCIDICRGRCGSRSYRNW